MKLTFKIKPLVKFDKFEDYRNKTFKSKGKAFGFLASEYHDDMIIYKYVHKLELHDFCKYFKIVKVR